MDTKSVEHPNSPEAFTVSENDFASMGGGFGGCTINIIKQEAVNSLVEEVTTVYKKATGINLDSIVVANFRRHGNYFQ